MVLAGLASKCAGRYKHAETLNLGVFTNILLVV